MAMMVTPFCTYVAHSALAIKAHPDMHCARVRHHTELSVAKVALSKSAFRQYYVQVPNIRLNYLCQNFSQSIHYCIALPDSTEISTFSRVRCICHLLDMSQFCRPVPFLESQSSVRTCTITYIERFNSTTRASDCI
jgi:hypothetical protein